MNNKLVLEVKVSEKTQHRYFVLKVCDTDSEKILTWDISVICFILDLSEKSFLRKYGDLGIYDIGFIQRDL